jgi:hypothetical protein
MDKPSSTRCKMTPDISPYAFAHTIMIASMSSTTLINMVEVDHLEETLFLFGSTNQYRH